MQCIDHTARQLRSMAKHLEIQAVDLDRNGKFWEARQHEWRARCLKAEARLKAFSQ